MPRPTVPESLSMRQPLIAAALALLLGGCVIFPIPIPIPLGVKRVPPAETVEPAPERVQ